MEELLHTAAASIAAAGCKGDEERSRRWLAAVQCADVRLWSGHVWDWKRGTQPANVGELERQRRKNAIEGFFGGKGKGDIFLWGRVLMHACQQLFVAPSLVIVAVHSIPACSYTWWAQPPGSSRRGACDCITSQSASVLFPFSCTCFSRHLHARGRQVPRLVCVSLCLCVSSPD